MFIHKIVHAIHEGNSQSQPAKLFRANRSREGGGGVDIEYKMLIGRIWCTKYRIRHCDSMHNHLYLRDIAAPVCNIVIHCYHNLSSHTLFTDITFFNPVLLDFGWGRDV